MFEFYTFLLTDLQTTEMGELMKDSGGGCVHDQFMDEEEGIQNGNHTCSSTLLRPSPMPK